MAVCAVIRIRVADNYLFQVVFCMKSKHDFPSLNTKRPDGVKPDGTHVKVIVVEPSDFQRKQIIQILESEEYDVVADVENGDKALRVLDRLGGAVDIVTTALDMPVLDGYALIFQMNEKKYRTKVVFISEDTTKGVLQDILKLGAADYILKPVNRLRILERMKAVVNKL